GALRVFSLTPRPPPISTLFPYTTLFRSQDHDGGQRGGVHRGGRLPDAARRHRPAGQCHGRPRRPEGHVAERVRRARRGGGGLGRSEEHTSELQSRENLVCRLLLEKKNRV